MAKKKPKIKTKKLHPGGSVDGRTPVTGTAPVTKQQRNNVGQMKPVTGIAPAPSPTQSPATFQKEPGALIPGPSQRPQPRNPSRKEIAAIRRRQRRNKRKIKQTVPGPLTPKQIKRATQPLPFAIPSMPTAGISQGRPARGRTPMPGPAPDAARMRRMQQLMREQQARFNVRRQTEAAREAASGIFQKQQKAALERRKGLGDKIEANRKASRDRYRQRRRGRSTGFK